MLKIILILKLFYCYLDIEMNNNDLNDFFIVLSTQVEDNIKNFINFHYQKVRETFKEI
jgi:hypothetical protein